MAQLEKMRGVISIAFGVGVERRLRFADRRVGVHLGVALFALDLDDGGDADVLVTKYDIVSAVLYIVMLFTHVVVSNTIEPLAQRIIASMKYSTMQLFASQQVNLDANFDCIILLLVLPIALLPVI